MIVIRGLSWGVGVANIPLLPHIPWAFSKPDLTLAREAAYTEAPSALQNAERPATQKSKAKRQIGVLAVLGGSGRLSKYTYNP